MDAAFKAKWLEALRGTEYEQTTGVLRGAGKEKDHSYCCLGVACVVMGGAWGTDVDRPFLGDLGMEDDDEAVLSDGALSLIGLTQPAQIKLAEMNDNGADFRAIADYIEANL